MAKVKNKGLGRGLESLFDDNFASLDLSSNTGPATLRLADIEPMSSQPRKNFDEEALSALTKSIMEHGVLQPIIVRQNPAFEGTYEIIAGERRWRAARDAGLSEIPAIILDADDLNAVNNKIKNYNRWDPIFNCNYFALLGWNAGCGGDIRYRVDG